MKIYLTEWKQTKFYEEAKEEGKLETKLEMILVLVRLGLNTEQIAQELELNLEVVCQYLASQDN
jgi:predicted transposase YdaD